MRITENTIVTLTESDIEELIKCYLKEKGILKDNLKCTVYFNTKKEITDEDLFSPGIETIRFEGCTVTLSTK